jgi:hypothetical protein
VNAGVQGEFFGEISIHDPLPNATNLPNISRLV